MAAMTRAAPLLALLLSVPAAFAKEEGGTDCGLYAVLRGDDKGELAIYDGVRKGLELARLPRVCLEEVDPWPGGLKALLDRFGRTGERGPLFAVGDEAGDALAALTTTIPRVFVVQRYTVERQPLRPLPQAEGAAVVYADLGAEHVRQVLLAMLGAERGGCRPAMAWEALPPKEGAWMRFRQAAKVFPELESEPYDLVLHLRVGVGERLLPFEQALALARRHHVPLVTDDRGRFGQGAVVTLVPAHGLVGRAAAEAARQLRYDPTSRPAPRAIRAVEVWVDLNAADEQDLELPLPFIARADRLRRSRVGR